MGTVSVTAITQELRSSGAIDHLGFVVQFALRHSRSPRVDVARASFKYGDYEDVAKETSP